MKQRAGGPQRIAVVGAGLAGSLLAWRLLTARWPGVLDVFVGEDPADATAVSGGLVRGFETDPVACAAAARSLAELRAGEQLRQWAGYREIGSTYILRGGAVSMESVRTVARWLPGSITVEPAGAPLRGVTAGTTMVKERWAGYFSPARLRNELLTALARPSGPARVTLHRTAVTGVRSGPALLVSGRRLSYDVVVLATGAWTRRLLGAGGGAAAELNTRQIQYVVRPGSVAGLGAFVDEVSGLYGRPAGRAEMLLGLPSDRWDVEPGAVEPDPRLVARTLLLASRRLGLPAVPQEAVRCVAGFDSYHRVRRLELRSAGDPGVFTLCGGSGAAAKTALAVTRDAAGELVGS